MKKKRLFVMFLLIALCLSCHFSCASTIKYAPIGDARDIISAVSVYCNEWQELIGSAFGYDISFNLDNMSKKRDKHFDMGGNVVITYNFDGITAEVAEDSTVYQIQVPIALEGNESHAAMARIFALRNIMMYGDYPESSEKMIERYLVSLTEYTEFMDKNKDAIADGQFVYWTFESEKEEFEFQFVSIDGHLRMIFDKMYFTDDE